MLTVIFVEDKGTYLVNLPRGNYSIDKKLFSFYDHTCPSIELTEQEIKNICPIEEKTFFNSYINQENEILSISDYKKQQHELISKGNWDDCSEHYEFDDFEDEINYLRFQREWSGISKTIQIIHDPLPVSIIKSKVNTGCEFIIPKWTTGESIDNPLCTYNFKAAMIDAVKTVFKELGMKRNDDCDYALTKNEKIYSYSNDTNLRFWKAFGSYLFSDKHWIICTSNKIVGEMEVLIKRYKTDVARIRKELIAQYKIAFSDFTKEQAVKVIKTIRNDITDIQRKTNELDVKIKSNRDYNQLRVLLETLASKLDSALVDKKEKVYVDYDS